MAFDYYYGISSEQYSFYRIPKSLMFGDDFRELSLQANFFTDYSWIEWECPQRENGLITKIVFM